jgi:hypothetical protein
MAPACGSNGRYDPCCLGYEPTRRASIKTTPMMLRTALTRTKANDHGADPSVDARNLQTNAPLLAMTDGKGCVDLTVFFCLMPIQFP